MDLIINGWKPGLMTISLVRLLQTACGMGLKEAKDAVDDVLAGREVRITGFDEVTAEKLRIEIESLGALCCGKY